MPGNLNEQRGRENQNDNLRRDSVQRDQQQSQPDDLNVRNPQKGSSWNNYQSRELGDDEEGRLSAEEASQAFEEE